MAHAFACQLGLIAFATAALQGAWRGTAFQETLTAALAALAGFYGLGWIVGQLTRQMVEEQARTTLTSAGDEPAGH